MQSFQRQECLLKSLSLIFIILFLIIEIIFLFNNRIVIWDESVYVSMGKYLFSQGSVGLWEIMRPVIMPLIFGFGWFLGFNQLFFASFVELLFSLGVVLMTYLVCKECFGREEGFVSVVLLLVTPVFVFYSGYLLTEIPSAFFGLVAVYFFIKNRFFYSGIFSSLAFLTRFPQGVVFISLIILFLFSDKLKTKLFNSVKFGSGFILILFPYLVFNYFFYREYTGFFSAVFRPFLFAVYEEGNPFQIVSLGLFDNLIYYFDYFFETNPAIIMLLLVGVFVFFKEKYYLVRDKRIVFVVLLLLLSYYIKILNKQERFSLAFLPYLVIIGSVGAVYLLNRWRYISSAVMILLLLFSLKLDYKIIDERLQPASGDYSEYYLFFKYNNVDGAVFTSDPVPSAYVDKRFIPYYLAYDEKHFDKLVPNNDWEVDEKIGAVIFATNALPCKDDDLECLNKRASIISELSRNKLIFNKTYFGQEHLIFISN